MSLRSSLLRLLDQPSSTTVLTSCPTNSRLSGRGTHSSSRSRTSFGHLTPKLQSRNRPVASHTGEVGENLVQGVAGLEVVIQCLHGHTGSHKDWSASKDIWVAVNDALFVHP